MKKVYITSGDPDGIGLEVSAKALYKLGPQAGVQFILFRSSYRADKWLRLIDKKFQRKTYKSLRDVAKADFFQKKNFLIDICSEELAPHWFKDAVKACLKNTTDCVVTGPLSKPLFLKSGLKVMGHTGLLKTLSKNKNLFMAFVGKHFNVLLATDHIPLQNVSKTLSPYLLNQALFAASQLRNTLPKKLQRKPLAVLGLNPHSGDEGLIGLEEKNWLAKYLKKKSTKSLPLVGPMVPDAAFVKSHWKKYSLFVCMYHDQGLIPFKAIHGKDSGIHITLGLPFLRVSVDHGTAKDIFNKNLADPGSMMDALKYAIKNKG